MIPLLEVRQVKPSLLLRQDGGARKPQDWAAAAAIAAVAVLLAIVATWQAASLRVGASVYLGFVGLALVLHLLGWLLVRGTRPLANAPWFPLRQAVLHLSRPGNQTRVILLTVGLGTFFIMGVRGLQVNRLEQFARQFGDDTPDMFLIDIQEDQAAALSRFLAERIPAAQPKLIPVMRARVTGRGVNLDEIEDVRGRGMLSREYVVTYRDQLEPNETNIAGRFWERSDTAADEIPQVSIEERVRERFRIDVGDLMRFDVLGRVIQARVTSIREVDWRDGRNGGFMFVFKPGVLEGAPHTYIAPVRVPGTADERARLQHDLVVRFANVSIIDLRQMLDAVRKVFDVVTVAISIVGTLVLLTGALILVGAVAVTKFQRMYEAAIFKTLGANSRLIAVMLMLEYGLLGTLAGLAGSFGAIALGWGVSRYALDIPWSAAVEENVAGTLITSVVVMFVGVAASFDVLRRKPLGTLRAE
jgi:putative ABC transport system permease protein